MDDGSATFKKIILTLSSETTHPGIIAVRLIDGRASQKRPSAGDMRVGHPTSRQWRAAAFAMRASAFEHDVFQAGRREGHGSEAGEANAYARIEQSHLVGMKLADAVVVGRGGELREQLAGRDLFGEHLGLLRDSGLRHAKGGVDESRGVDLLGDEVGMGGIKRAQVEGFLEVQKQPLPGEGLARTPCGTFPAPPLRTAREVFPQAAHPTGSSVRPYCL